MALEHKHTLLATKVYTYVHTCVHTMGTHIHKHQCGLKDRLDTMWKSAMLLGYMVRMLSEGENSGVLGLS